MARTVILQLSKQWSPAAVGTSEAPTLWNIGAGCVIAGAFARVLTAWAGGSTATVSLGDSGSATRYIKTGDITVTSAALTQGTGSGFATVPGYLVTTETGILVTYTPGATPGATDGVVRFTIRFFRIEPS